MVASEVHIRMSRSDRRQTVGFSESLDLFVDVGRLGEATNHENILQLSVCADK